MKQDLSKNFREVNIILDLLGNTYKSKLPKKLKSLFDEMEEKTYNPAITIEDFRAGNLLEETKTLLSILYVNYWAGENKKTQYMEELKSIDEKCKEGQKLVLHEIFPEIKPDTKVEPNNEEKQITETKKSGIAQMIMELLEKIKAIFKK